MVDVQNQSQRLERTAESVAAYISRNAVPAAELPTDHGRIAAGLRWGVPVCR